MIALIPHAEGVVLPVKVSPGARRAGLLGVHDGMLRVAVTAAPEQGKATAAVLELLAEGLSLRRAQLTVLTGATSPRKRILVRGITEESLRAALDRALAE